MRAREKEMVMNVAVYAALSNNGGATSQTYSATFEGVNN